MAALALILDRHAEDALLADIIEHGHTVAMRVENAADLLEQLEQVQLDAVITGASHAALSRELLSACDRRGVRLIALARDAAERRHAAELGLYDVVDGAARWEAVEALLSAQIPAPLPLQFTDGGPETDAAGVVVVWGPAGAPGRSSMAIAIAAELAASGAGVVLVDADSYGGTIAAALGLPDEAPGFAAACRLAAVGALTTDELDRVAATHRSRAGQFRVLTGIGRASRWPELGATRVSAVLAACRRWCEVVVVDVGFSLETDEAISSDLFAPHRNAATIAALQASDRVVAVGAPDPIGLPRFLRGYAELVDLLDGQPVSVLINRVRGGAVGLDAAGQLRATLRRFGGIEQAGLVPEDQRAFDGAVLAGRTIIDEAPKSKARQAVTRFVADELHYAGARVDAH